MALLRQDYASLPDSVELAARHARAVVAKHSTMLIAERAERIVRAMTEEALSRTPPDDVFTVITEIQKGHVRFEIVDLGQGIPGRPAADHLSVVSVLADLCGVSSGGNGGGHTTAWASLFLPDV